MNTTHKRTRSMGIILIVLILAACQSSNPVPAAINPGSTSEWHTYSSTKYKFSIQYPSGWKVTELSVPENSTEQSQVWFAAEDFPPPNTGAQPDLTLIITETDPSARWEQEYFDEYRSEIIQVGGGTATRISGVNKESQYRETVVIMKLDGVYVQMLPGQSEQAVEFFDRILATFDSQ